MIHVAKRRLGLGEDWKEDCMERGGGGAEEE